MKSRCPVCKKVIGRVLLEQSRREGFYPFCCNRCKLIDLGCWIDGKYRISTKLKPEDDEGAYEGGGENAGQSEGEGGY
ncbi:MAG: DNA gyrase inhibitor YacG [Planctomycetota bacterium]